MKKKILIVAGAVILIAVIVIASVKGGGTKGEKVYAEPVKPRTIQAIVTAPGEIDPKVKVNISAHIVGKIERLYFNEGDKIRKGQKLVDLEKFAYQAQYDRARAALANSNIEVTRAKAALGTADAAYKRAVNLERQGIQAQELFDRSRQDYQNAQAGYASAEEGVRQAQALLQQARTDLDRTTILSPIDGKAVQLNAHEGEVVVTGTMNNPGSVIAVIADLSQILAEAEVGETEVVSIRENQPARIKVDAVVDLEYTGHVVEIGSSAAVRQGAGAGIRYFKVKTAIDNADERLRPGMTAQVSIVTSRAQNVVTVPIQSVVERVPGQKAGAAQDDDKPKKKYVFMVADGKDGKAKQVEVTTGISDATHVTVLSGVKVGDDVVTGPFRTLKKLNDGEAVQVTREEKKASKDEDESS